MESQTDGEVPQIFPKRAVSTPVVPKRGDYRLLVETSWDDIHHSRGQDWRALLVVAAVHFGVLQGIGQESSSDLPISHRWLLFVGAILALAFVGVGVLVTCRHYHLMRVKLGWIYRAEEQLGLVRSDSAPGGIIPSEPSMKRDLPWKLLRWPRLFSVSWLMISFYFLLALLDLGAIAFCWPP